MNSYSHKSHSYSSYKSYKSHKPRHAPGKATILITLLLFTVAAFSGCNTPPPAKPAKPAKAATPPTLPRVPSPHWQQYAAPEEAGFSSAKLAQAKAFYQSNNAAALMVIYRGAVLIAWGDTQRRYRCHSMRKSIMSALYGIYVEKGRIDTAKTIKQLNIDDKQGLTETEKEARIIDLLKARSGVYHPAAGETKSMKRQRPKRGSHRRDTFWYYNNWDFNTLCTIFKQETGLDFFQAFNKDIAQPLQMEDFDLKHTHYLYERDNSIHPAYLFRMSARDLGRFGLLFQRKGRWKGHPLIPAAWVAESTGKHSNTGWRRSNYGYMWWVNHKPRFKDLGMFSAYGVGGQRLHVLPGAQLVFVHRVDTYNNKKIKDKEIYRLLNMILDAKISEPKRSPRLIRLPDQPPAFEPVPMETERLKRYVGDYRLTGGFRASITMEDGELWIYFPEISRFRLLPLSPTHFIMEDFQCPVHFKIDTTGNPTAISIHFSKTYTETGSPNRANSRRPKFTAFYVSDGQNLL